MIAALVAAMIAQVSISNMTKADTVSTDEQKSVHLECVIEPGETSEPSSSAVQLQVTAYPAEALATAVTGTGYTMTNVHAAFTPDRMIFSDGGRYPATFVIDRHDLHIDVSGSWSGHGQCKIAEIKTTKF